MKVKIKKLHPDAVIPQKASKLAGAYDVTVTSIEHVAENYCICKIGLALRIPSEYKLILVPRSSLTKHNWVLGNHIGIGDADYLGEYQFRFRAIPTGINQKMSGFTLKYDEFPFKEGDRIGQVFLMENIDIEFEECNNLGTTERGEGGFGSTGL